MRARARVSSSTVPSAQTRRARPASTASVGVDPLRGQQDGRPPAATPAARGAASCWPPRGARPSRRRGPGAGPPRPSAPGRRGRAACTRAPRPRRGPRPAAACRRQPAVSSRPPEARAGLGTGVAGGDGRHLAQVLAGGEGPAPPGQHHDVDRRRRPGRRPARRSPRRYMAASKALRTSGRSKAMQSDPVVVLDLDPVLGPAGPSGAPVTGGPPGRRRR